MLLLFHTNYAYKPPSFILWLQASCFNYASCKYWPWFILSLSTYPWGFPVPLVHCFPQNLFHFCYIQDREGQNLSVRPVVLHSTMLSLTFLQISSGLLSFECCQALCPHICNAAYRELQFYFLSFNSWTRTCHYILTDQASIGRFIFPFVFRDIELLLPSVTQLLGIFRHFCAFLRQFEI